MQDTLFHPSTAIGTSRRGMATLEFAMALPVLLVLMVGITWLGFSVIGQTEVLVEARNKAWKKRFDDAGKEPLMFPVGLAGVDSPFYPREKDYVTEKASKRIQVSPVFDVVPGPEASHTVLAGSWDYRAMPMQKRLNVDLYLRAAANAATREIQTKLGKLNNLIQNVQQSGVTLLQQALSDAAGIENAKSNSESESKAGEAKANKDAADERDKLQKRREAIGGMSLYDGRVIRTGDGELKRADDEIARLRAELVNKVTTNEPDPDKQKQKQAEIESIQRRLEVLEGTVKRLEMEVRDIDADLRALEDD